MKRLFILVWLFFIYGNIPAQLSPAKMYIREYLRKSDQTFFRIQMPKLEKGIKIYKDSTIDYRTGTFDEESISTTMYNFLENKVTLKFYNQRNSDKVPEGGGTFDSTGMLLSAYMSADNSKSDFILTTELNDDGSVNGLQFKLASEKLLVLKFYYHDNHSCTIVVKTEGKIAVKVNDDGKPVSELHYDINNKLKSQKYFEYDSFGNEISEKHISGKETRIETHKYDAKNRLIEESDNIMYPSYDRYEYNEQNSLVYHFHIFDKKDTTIIRYLRYGNEVIKQ